MQQRTKREEELLAKITLLLVEDEEPIREMLHNVCAKFCKEVYVAQDGMEGLEMFLQNKPDIVITDIGMPHMNGLDMSWQIRQSDQDVPIIVETAFGDEHSLIDSIDIGVDKYIKKPLSIEAVIDAIVQMAQRIENRAMAEEYRQKLQTQKLRENTQAVLSEMANILSAPLLVLQEGNIRYVNEAFEQMVGEKLGEVLAKPLHFDTLLDPKEGFVTALIAAAPQEDNTTKYRISLHQNGRKIYQVSQKEIRFATEEFPSVIYLFEDVTMLEYQRLKIENYSQRLEDFIITTKYKKKTPLSQPRAEVPKETQAIQAIQAIQEVPPQKEAQRKFDYEEIALLRKSHLEPVSAEAFVASMDETVYEDVDELRDLLLEMRERFEIFCEETSRANLLEITMLLEKYAHTIKLMQEFDELAQALFSTCDVLNNVEEFDAHAIETMRVFLESIFEDLSSWRTTIFQDKIAQDIHYLDASLFSSCLQLELSLTQAEVPEEDIEFF